MSRLVDRASKASRAAISARAPDAFTKGGGAIVRLFPDFRAEEERFFKKTGIFPIMHLITLRRAAFEQYPSRLEGRDGTDRH